MLIMLLYTAHVSNVQTCAYGAVTQMLTCPSGTGTQVSGEVSGNINAETCTYGVATQTSNHTNARITPTLRAKQTGAYGMATQMLTCPSGTGTQVLGEVSGDIDTEISEGQTCTYGVAMQTSNHTNAESSYDQTGAYGVATQTLTQRTCMPGVGTQASSDSDATYGTAMQTSDRIAEINCARPCAYGPVTEASTRTQINAPILPSTDPRAWKIVKNFARGASLSQTENDLRDLLGDSYSFDDWQQTFDVVFAAEDNTAAAVLAVESLEQQAKKQCEVETAYAMQPVPPLPLNIGHVPASPAPASPTPPPLPFTPSELNSGLEL